MKFLWWTKGIGWVHYASAVVLFSSFCFFCLRLFPKTKPGEDQVLPFGKRARNSIYKICGYSILGCMAWAGIAGYNAKPIFLPEALALEFFAFSWLTKSRADLTAIAAGRRILYYGLHPKELPADIRDAIRGKQRAN